MVWTYVELFYLIGARFTLLLIHPFAHTSTHKLTNRGQLRVSLSCPWTLQHMKGGDRN